MAFGDKDAGFEDLSSSFRSLYSSLFGSVGSVIPTHHIPNEQEYTNGASLLQRTESPSNSIGYSTIGTSMSRTIVNMADTRHAPPFTSLMDNLKDIAENNQWEILNLSQIQSLRDSFKSGNHNNFGMDQESFLEWSHSFDQFLSQLDSRIPINAHGSGSLPHSSYHLSDHLAPPPPYSQHTSVSNYSSRMNPPFAPPSSVRDSSNSTGHLQLQNIKTPPLFRSAATDLLEEDDDEFDWSKLV